jgi:rhodanese-related sulfurtransferase
MKRVVMIVLMGVLGMTVAACGGATATTTGEVAPAPNAPVISPDTYVSSVADSMDHVLVDVREVGEVNASGVIPGAINIPLSEFASRVNELPADTTVVVYCNSGNRSRSAVNILNQNGYEQLLDLGGVQQWRRAGMELVPLGQ